MSPWVARAKQRTARGAASPLMAFLLTQLLGLADRVCMILAFHCVCIAKVGASKRAPELRGAPFIRCIVGCFDSVL